MFIHDEALIIISSPIFLSNIDQNAKVSIRDKTKTENEN